MKKAILIVLAVVAFLYILHIPEGEVKSVLYGERHAVFNPTENTSRLFVDKRGHLYPDEIIPDSIMTENQAFVKEYFRNNTQAFQKNAIEYGLNSSIWSDDNFIVLQDSMITRLVDTINTRLTHFSSVYILIHGFRKPIASQNSTTSAFVDNLVIQSAVTMQTRSENYFIEIYWDGMYDFFEFQKRNQHRETFMLFEKEARTNAVFAAYSLRKVISKLKTSNINIISHSLGARVALGSLFNTYDEYVDESLQRVPTPAQDTLNICLIAPAIGSTAFEEYYERNTELNFAQKDNYKLYILFNEEDVVLLKKVGLVGPGPKRFGNTTLGCNYEGAAFQLKETFDNQYPNSQISLIEATVGKTHLTEHYVLSDAFRTFLYQSGQLQ